MFVFRMICFTMCTEEIYVSTGGVQHVGCTAVVMVKMRIYASVILRHFILALFSYFDIIVCFCQFL